MRGRRGRDNEEDDSEEGGREVVSRIDRKQGEK